MEYITRPSLFAHVNTIWTLLGDALKLKFHISTHTDFNIAWVIEQDTNRRIITDRMKTDDSIRGELKDVILFYLHLIDGLLHEHKERQTPAYGAYDRQMVEILRRIKKANNSVHTGYQRENDLVSSRFDYGKPSGKPSDQTVTNDFKQILKTITSKLEEFVRSKAASYERSCAETLLAAVSEANIRVQSLYLNIDEDWKRLMDEVTVMKSQLERFNFDGLMFFYGAPRIAGVVNDAIGSIPTEKITGLDARNEYGLNLIAGIGRALKKLRQEDGSIFDALGDATEQTKLDEIFHIMASAKTYHVAIWNVLYRLAMIIQRNNDAT